MFVFVLELVAVGGVLGHNDCLGKGKLESTLGYASIGKSSNTPVRSICVLPKLTLGWGRS